MYCPKCGYEYRDGFKICSDCEETLIDDIPKIEKNGSINHNKVKNLVQRIEIIEKEDRYEKINKKSKGIYALAGAHLIIAVNYLYQLYRFTKGSILLDDPIVRNVIVDAMTYISIIVSLILVTFNLVSSVGLIKEKAWAWWLSGSYFISLIPQSIISITFHIMLGFEVQSSLDSHYSFPYIDKIYSSLYLSIIALLVVVFLFHDHIYNKYNSNRLSKKASVFILLGVGVGIIILRYLLSVLGSMF